MSTYLVKASYPLSSKVNGTDAILVTAKDLTSAKALVAGTIPQGSTPPWQAGATYTDVTTVSDLTGWTFNVTVNTTTATNVTYTGVTGDTYDKVGAALVLLLNASVGTGITHASYSTPNLSVTGTSDALGAKTAAITVTPAISPLTGLSIYGNAYSWNSSDLVTAVTAAGTSTQALIVTFNSAFVIPQAFEGHGQSGFAPLVEHEYA